MGSICFFQRQMPRGMVPCIQTSPKKGHTKVAICNTTQGGFTAASSATCAASALQGMYRELETGVKHNTGSKHSCIAAERALKGTPH